LTVNREIIQALTVTGYTRVSTYSTFNMLPTTINLLHAGVTSKSDEVINFCLIFIKFGSLFDRQIAKDKLTVF